MGESALRSQALGEAHKKQEKVMSWSFVNFSQVKTETATTPQLNTFGFKRVHWQKLSVFYPKFSTGCGTSGSQCQNLRICVSIIVLENYEVGPWKVLDSALHVWNDLCLRAWFTSHSCDLRCFLVKSIFHNSNPSLSYNNHHWVVVDHLFEEKRVDIVIL